MSALPGRAMKFWLVPCAPGTYVYAPCHAFAHSFVLVNHFKWNVSTSSGSGRRLGEDAREIQA